MNFQTLSEYVDTRHKTFSWYRRCQNIET